MSHFSLGPTGPKGKSPFKGALDSAHWKNPCPSPLGPTKPLQLGKGQCRQLPFVYLHVSVSSLALHVLIISRYVAMFALAFRIFFTLQPNEANALCALCAAWSRIHIHIHIHIHVHCLATGQWIDWSGLWVVGCGPENMVKTGSVPP